MRLKMLGLAAALALALTVPVGAHHSHGNYNLTKWAFVEGVVTELHFLAPHSILYLEVKDEKGEATVWSMEANSATGLIKNGVKREEVRPGDRVKVRCFQLRDGSPGCLLGFVTPQHGDATRGHGIERDWT